MRPYPSNRHLSALAGCVLLALSSWGCSEEPTTSFQGYVEGEYLYLSSPLGGRLDRLSARRGMEVKAGETLLVLEHAFESAGQTEATEGLHQAENRLADLEKGDRPAELSTLAAQLDQARVTLGQAEREFSRRRKLFAAQTISLEELDQARSAKEHAKAQVAEFSARLTTARLGGREDAIKALTAEVAAAKERVAKAAWQLEQKTLVAPQAGYIEDTFYEDGEFVPASSPVLSLLPPGKITIRFFVPEPMVGKLAVGEAVTVSYDGVERPLRATISSISSQAEFTPPIIYSRTTRAKLVFLVEAHPVPQEASRLHPGQPVDVIPATPHE